MSDGINHETVKISIPLEYASQRLDAVLVKMFPDYSRSRLQAWIKAERVKLDGATPRARDKVIGGELLEVSIEHEMCDEEVIAQDIPLDIIYEDDDILVINKPVGLIVHPGAGHPDGTLQNGLLFHDEKLHGVPRSGIVHRLDKDTSGLLVVAKTLKAHKLLVEQLQERTVHREYLAIVLGVFTSGGTIDKGIGRSGRDRKKMAVKPEGKQAITHFRVLDRYRGHSRIKVNLETGRTHQIRVHMAHVKHPLVGDQTYGGRLQLPPGCGDELKEMLRGFDRQALHARKLGLIHPSTGKHMEWSAPLPDDMKQLVKVLEDDIAQVSQDDEYYQSDFMEEFSDEFTDEH
ncbi:MAG: 23S rRNA pseudouridine(1911/1915/1917) synthase RluD [endosymbiont of Galathealinum brachiosum]|uniref:Pseudouridine synthase n=1 Tax=endosymbiont of Galathealinum brachiosum TaxID=2200906 RepID=A0A370DAI7_9GAMM|nr:MAG: 23S rRNA pseudouridine(1911/1915/1917) synthase RluD [endosymbiont of Galathealinum brachiosum]